MTQSDLSQADAALMPLALALAEQMPDGFALAAASVCADRPVAAAERDMVRGAVPKRQADFITGRWCAHTALSALGYPVDPLTVGPLGAPVWPAGALGSITHDQGWCLAAAGPMDRIRGIGIDLYARADLSVLPGLSALIHSQPEGRRYAEVLRCEHHLRSLFCVKEAVVKAVSEVAGHYLDLRDIDVRVQGARFEAAVLGVRGRVCGWHAVFGPGAIAMATFEPAG